MQIPTQSGNQNNFSFLLLIKKNKEKIEKDNNLDDNLIFYQDNAACHTLGNSKSTIDISFLKDYIDWSQIHWIKVQ